MYKRENRVEPMMGHSNGGEVWFGCMVSTCSESVDTV